MISDEEIERRIVAAFEKTIPIFTDLREAVAAALFAYDTHDPELPAVMERLRHAFAALAPYIFKQ